MNNYCVYFYYGADDELLYIGKAVDVGVRWGNHLEDWKKDVCKVGVREYPDCASMDIFEHYYITKYPTKYNVAQLTHGYTSVDIPDSSELKIYTVEEFKKKYVLHGSRVQKHPRINMAFYDDNLEYLQNAAWRNRMSITEYVNQLIAEDIKKNRK